jgi:hypothetical protein
MVCGTWSSNTAEIALFPRPPVGRQGLGVWFHDDVDRG